MEKLTLEKFLIIKKKLSVVIEVLSKEYADRIETFNYEEIAKIINDRYITIQKELYDYDLSDIPFEAWKDVVIIGTKDHIADFSKTKANIDFNIVECDGYANFKGCNVRNIDNLYGYHYPEMFDKEVVESKNSYFISDLFDEEFKNKYYNNLLEVTDLVSLSSEQIDELKQKKWHYKLKVGFKYDYMWAIFPLEKCIQLYNTSLEEYETVGEIIDIFRYSSNRFFQKFVSEINNIDASQIKNMCFDFVRANIYSYDGNNRRLEDYPPLFKKENPNLYLEGVNIPDDVKKRYFERCLTIQDYLDYTDTFDDIVIDYFMNSSLAKTINENFGPGEFQKLVANHRDVFEYLNVNDNRFLTTSSYWQSVRENAELTFIDAVKNYYIQNKNLEGLEEKINEDGTKEYILPNWLSSLNFVVKGKISTKKDLLEYNEHVILEDRFQYRMLNTLNIDNIKKFDAETGFFTKIEERNSLQMLDAFEYFIMDTYNSPLTVNRGIDFKGGMLSYDEFKNMMAKTLDYMRRINIFTDYPDYEWMNGGSFSKEHPEIFIDKNAPSELRSAFYRRGITPKTLFHHWEYIPYLLKTDLKNTIRLNMTLLSRGPAVPSLNLTYLPAEEDFILQYLKRYGKEKVLNLIARYGSILSGLVIKNYHDEIENEETIEKVIQEAIYNKIIKENADYMYLEQVPELVNRYPDIFVNFSSLKDYGYEVEERLSLKRRFYEGKFTYDTIKQHPRLIPLLKDKNLYIAFRNQIGTKSGNRLIIGNNPYSYDTTYSDLELLTVYGNEKFLELCCKYGSYLDNITKHLYKNIDVRDNKYIDKKTGKEISYEEIDRRIEEIIIKEVRAGIMGYDPDYAPEFLKKKCPDLFLNDDAPEELKKCFYHMSSNYGMSFIILNKNKDWLNYLNGKAIITSLLRNARHRSGLEIFFRLFGEEKGMKLGVSRAETVCKMLEDNKVELMKSWYDKTGGKFIPDYVVMQNFSIEEADKFLSSSTDWSALMKIKRFSWSPNGRDAMLKIAYAFGVFDNDKRGFKKTMELLTDIPRKIDADKGYIIGRIDDVIDKYSNRPKYFRVKVSRNLDGNSREMTPEEKESSYLLTLNTAQNSAFLDIFDHNVLVNFLETIKNEKVDIDFAKPIFGQIYRKNDDGSYSLTINPQSYPKTTEIVRDILEKTRLLPVLNMDSAHRFLGGFKLEYDPEFREFFLKNYDTIMNDNKYLSQIATIQRRFKEIKAVYSNVTLTLDLALSYITNNRYEQVNPGNERVTTTAAIQGYSQEDFEKLQRIYNYGKQRVFSSIPRIESNGFLELKTGRYHYEMLRLDDPRAMSIGYESDCCQRLGEPAEMCMQHSMVDKNGRVFVITNELGEVVAQSWVWRNKDVLCFDNIEIPDQKMWDHGVPRGSEDSGIRNEFTDDILDIYKMAAHELIEEDEKEYKELLESGKITQEQYDGLRLKKISTGEGYSNIIGSLKTLPVDKGTLSRPLPFEAPVELNRGLYISDSRKQYIIEERKDKEEDEEKYDGETLTLYSDTYIEYDDTNFTEKELLTLEKLEGVTKEEYDYLDTSVNMNTDRTKLVSAIAKNYWLHPETTRIILHPNFAIIYDTYGDKVTIGDLLFNTKIDNYDQQMDITDKVIMQIRLAINQISNGKQIVLQDLSEKQQQMYEKVMGLRDEMDIERGVGHAR